MYLFNVLLAFQNSFLSLTPVCFCILVCSLFYLIYSYLIYETFYFVAAQLDQDSWQKISVGPSWFNEGLINQ